MWDLNKRLEAYLARVKFLEEENEVLRAEIQSAKGSPAGDSWRAKYEEELRALRDALDHAFREKCMAELARDNLYEEVQQVKSRCQKEQAAREEAKKQLSLSRKELEEERRAQIWLKERAVQLEKEVEALLEVHEEEKAGLDQEIASFSQSLESFRCAPVAFQPVEVEDYSKRLSEIWKGAVETYKTEVSQLETSLCQAKDNLWKAVEDNQQSQLQLQHLEKDLAGLKARKEMLEESLARQWQEQRGEAEKFQVGEGGGEAPVPWGGGERGAAGPWGVLRAPTLCKGMGELERRRQDGGSKPQGRDGWWPWVSYRWTGSLGGGGVEEGQSSSGASLSPPQQGSGGPLLQGTSTQTLGPPPPPCLGLLLHVLLGSRARVPEERHPLPTAPPAPPQCWVQTAGCRQRGGCGEDKL